MDSSECDSDSVRSASNVRLPIICRHNPYWWWMVIPGFFIPALIFWSPFLPNPQNPGQPQWQVALICWPLGLTLLFGLLTMAFDLRYGEIRADETGLTWRRYFGRRKSVRWDEITDFYVRRQGDERVVVTPVGTMELSSRYYDIAKIVDLVPRRASAVAKFGWEPKTKWGRPPKPIVFKAWGGEELWMAPMVTAFILWGIVCFFLSPPKASGHRIPPESFRSDFGYKLLDAIPFAAFCGGFLLTMALMWREWNSARRLKGEEVRLDAQGITFKSPQKTVAAKWQEVLAVKYLDRVNGFIPIEFRTTQGNFVIWWGGYGNGLWPKIRRRTRLLAPGLLVAQEDFWLRQPVDGERSAWTGNAAGQGSPHWSFRSKGNRFFCQCISVVSLFVLFFYWVTSLTGSNAAHHFHPQGSWLTLAELCAGALLLIFVSWVWYHHASVVATEEALEIRFPFGLRRRAEWGDMDSLGRDAFGDFVKVKGRKLHFTWFLTPLRIEELREFIEDRIREN